jgi:hypothetical protein
MFHLILSELSRPLGEVNVCFPQHHLSISSPHTLNCSDGKGYFLPHRCWVLPKCAETSQGSLETWCSNSCMWASSGRATFFFILSLKSHMYFILTAHLYLNTTFSSEMLELYSEFIKVRA